MWGDGERSEYEGIVQADLLPSDIYRAWLEARRDMLRDIPDDFEILSASPKDDTTMTVTAEVYGINTMERVMRLCVTLL